MKVGKEIWIGHPMLRKGAEEDRGLRWEDEFRKHLRMLWQREIKNGDR